MPHGNTLEKLPIGDDKQRAALIAAHQSLGNIILGKDPEISLALACLLARGHLLIEDLPGLGKTILAQSLARVLGLSFQRIQFTSDLLPADIIGVSIFRQETRQFEIQRGPVFAELVLADEVTAQRLRRKAHFSRLWKNVRFRLTGRRMRYLRPTSSSPPRIHQIRSARFRFLSHNLIAF